MLVSLTEIFQKNKNLCVAAFNVFGYEDAISVLRAAEKRSEPVVLMANKIAIKHMGTRIFAKIVCTLAEESTIPVCVHLDHATELETIQEALHEGFSSIMFDGSQLSFEENVQKTKEAVGLAHQWNVSVEAEIGSVGYTDAAIFAEEYTDPETAKRFYDLTKVDALAVAVGSVHRMVTQDAVIQFDRIDKIRECLDVPLVIHGSSGIRDEDLPKLAAHGIRKINFGTCLRQAFGDSIRKTVNENPDLFDRIQMFQSAMDCVEKEASSKMLAKRGR